MLNSVNNLSPLGHQEIRASSGLKILFLKDESLPFIQYQMFFPRAGSDYDPEGKSGLSYFTALLSEQGAGGLDSEALQEELNQLGTELEIQVGRQTADIALSGLSWHGEKLWELFEKILTAPHFQEEEMEILKKQLLKSRLAALDQPSAVASELWRKGLFPGPVGESRQGTLLSLLQITLEDIKSFYKQRFLEGEPVLIAAGQYDKRLKQKIISFFERHFIYRGQPAEGFSIPQPPASFRLFTKKDLAQANIILGYPISAFPTENPRKFLALNLANAILGYGAENRLYEELRDKRGLTYGAYSSIDFGRLYGVFGVSGSTKTDSAKEFLSQTLSVLKAFREKGVSLAELNRAKQGMKSRYLRRIETPENQLRQLVYYTYYLGVDSKFLDNYLNILNDISLDEVNRLIQEFVLSKPLQALVYGHPSLREQLEGLEGWPPLQTFSFEDHFREELSFKK